MLPFFLIIVFYVFAYSVILIWLLCSIPFVILFYLCVFCSISLIILFYCFDYSVILF